MVSTRVITIFVLLACASLVYASFHQDIANKMKKQVKMVEKGREATRGVHTRAACPVTRCLAVGTNCTDDDACINSTCVITSQESDFGVCARYLQNGQPCQASSQCESSCLNGYCNGYGDPGDDCDNEYDCAYFSANYTYVTECINGACAGIPGGQPCVASYSCLPPYICKDGNCTSPAALGGECEDSDDCASPLICNSATYQCANRVANGGACRVDSDECQDDISKCVPTSFNESAPGICVAVFSQAAGAYCTESDDCGEGLFCNNDDDDDIGVCTQPAGTTSSKIPCDNSTQCRVGEECECNGGLGATYCYLQFYTPTGFKNANLALYNCIQQCADNDEACYFANCKNQYCAYITVYYNAYITYTQERVASCVFQDALAQLQYNLLSAGITCPNFPPTTGGSVTTGSAATTGPSSTTGPAPTAAPVQVAANITIRLTVSVANISVLNKTELIAAFASALSITDLSTINIDFVAAKRAVSYQIVATIRTQVLSNVSPTTISDAATANVAAALSSSSSPLAQSLTKADATVTVAPTSSASVAPAPTNAPTSAPTSASTPTPKPSSGAKVVASGLVLLCALLLIV